MEQPLLSVVFSFRNEALVLDELIRRTRAVLDPLPLAYELIFVNDASTDRSLPILMGYAETDSRIRIANTSRRFGGSECTLAGVALSTGDAVVFLDTDLQDPPELIPALITRWQDGADVVHTVRLSRAGEPRLKLALTHLAYRIIGAYSEVKLHPDAGDFKLLSRRAVTRLLELREHTPYLRGLVSWIGFPEASVTYHRAARAGGETKYPLFRHIIRDMANLRGAAGSLIIGLTSFTIFPIIIFVMFGMVVTIGALAGLVIWTGLWVGNQGVTPAVGLLLAVVFLAGVQLLGIGALGVYLGRAYQDVRGRPRYIIESTINLPEP